MNSLLSVQEIAQLTSFSVSTIYRYASGGILPSCKIGKRLMFKKEEVEKCLEKHRVLNFSENFNFQLKNNFKNQLTNKSPVGIDSVKGGAGRWYRSYCAKNGEKTRKVFSRIYGRELTPEEAQEIKKNLLNLGKVLLEINRGSDEVRDLHED